MLGIGFNTYLSAVIAQASRTQVDVFGSLYLVFLILGTTVGIVVISYTLISAYKYRVDGASEEGEHDIEVGQFDDGKEDEVARPELGEIPTGKGKGGGKKLALSFGMSAIIVLSLVIYAYTLLLYVEGAPQEQEDALEVDVTGFQFGWEYEYQDGQTANALVVPKGEVVVLNVTSDDVFHNWGVPELRAKADAIPGQYTTTWFQANETGKYTAVCYELCGTGHSSMNGPVYVLEPDDYEEWRENPEEFDIEEETDIGGS